MIARFDVYGSTPAELTAAADSEAHKAFDRRVPRSNIHIEAEAIQLMNGDIVGWVGSVTVHA